MNSRSQWLADVAADLPAVRKLDGDITVDVAIIGGGFVGLWTAIELKELDSACRVAVIEMGRGGGGASGLNGGFVMSWWPKIASLMRICGREDALWLADQTTQAVADLGGFLTRHGIDAGYRQTGWLWAATKTTHIGAWNGVVETAAKLGRGEIFQQVAAAEIARCSGSAAHLAGICEPINGTVHPGKLGLGLAQVAVKFGVELYEDTRVDHLDRSHPARLVTAGGTVTAPQVVITANAWATGFRNWPGVSSVSAAPWWQPRRLCQARL